MLNCKDTVTETSNYINKDLPISKRIGLFLHFMICQCCRNYLRQFEKTVETVSLVKPSELDKTNKLDLARLLQQVNKETGSNH